MSVKFAKKTMVMMTGQDVTAVDSFFMLTVLVWTTMKHQLTQCSFAQFKFMNTACTVNICVHISLAII